MNGLMNDYRKQLIGQDVLPMTFCVGNRKMIRFDAFDLPWKDLFDYRFRLILRGEPVTDAALLSEWGSGRFMRDIDDSLSTVTDHSQYSLRFPETEEKAERRAWYKLILDPPTYPGGLTVPDPAPEGNVYHFSFCIKAEEFAPLGEAEIRAEIYNRREGRCKQDISGEADRIVRFPIEAGTYGFRTVEAELSLVQVAAVLFCMSVGESRGTLWVEDVRLTGVSGLSLLPQFHPSSPYAESLNWYGENLAEHLRSDFLLSVNGGEAEKHSCFSYIYRQAENEFPLPDGALTEGRNQICLQYVSDYFCPVPYRITECALLAERKRPFRILSHPQTAVVGQSLTVAVETDGDNLTLTVKCTDAAVRPIQEYFHFPEAGLHVISFDVTAPVGEVRICVSCGDCTEELTLSRTVEREEDGILCGTGDAIYIAQDIDAMTEYLKWYLANGCGSFLTFRPVYHWSGTRSLQPEVWAKIIPFLNELHFPYLLLFDERELEGLNANPTRKELQGPYFIGFQGHEIDGVYYYWSNWMWGPQGNLYRELRTRLLRHPDLSYREPVVYRGDKTYSYYDDTACENMKEASETFERNLRTAVRGLNKHTGVTVQFRHFLRAGIEIPGAEIMYSNHEILMGALRGAAFAYDRSKTASHLALQWYSAPIGYPGFFERYRISLNLSYLHGISQINTEEGLWWMEGRFESYDRFSDYCKKNQQVARDFLRFVSCHTRRGTSAHLHGILLGNCDAYNSFSDCPAWHSARAGWEYGAAERAWEQIRLYFPSAAITHPRGCQSVTAPQGWYSPTPYGLCEILPAEAPADKLQAYPYLAFLGFNLADGEQLERLISYVEKGGKLLLCLCHLTDDPSRPNPADPLSMTSLVKGYEKLTGFRVTGVEGFPYRHATAEPCGAVPIGDGSVWEHRIGKGTVEVINSFDFPIGNEVSAIYRRELQSLADGVRDGESYRVEIGSEPVEYAVYDLPNGSKTIYFVHVGWYDPREKIEIKVHYAGTETILRVKKERIGILRIFSDFATYTCDETTEILSATEEGNRVSVILQGDSTASFDLIAPNLSQCPDTAVEKAGSVMRVIAPVNGIRKLFFERSQVE